MGTPVVEDEVAGAVDGQLPGGDDHCGLDRDPGGRVEAASERRMDGGVRRALVPSLPGATTNLGGVCRLERGLGGGCLAGLWSPPSLPSSTSRMGCSGSTAARETKTASSALWRRRNGREWNRSLSGRVPTQCR